MPDIDIDFSKWARPRNQLRRRSTGATASQIITFGTMMARAAVRDSGRVLDIPYGTVDKIAKLIPEARRSTSRTA